ncbi:MAG TPA: hypothetical protein DHV12_08805 [Thermotogae bacterium]|nr:uncharacterized protein [Thermotogota bacterium]HCZ07206.1 hypothetical protein [Thermotogota bacterium]
MRKLLESAKRYAGSATVEDYVIGLGLCAVKLSDGRAGLSYILRSEIRGGCSPLERTLETGQQAEEFIELYENSDPVKVSLGLATINACLNSVYEKDFKKGDLADFLQLEPDDSVAMVGDLRKALPAVGTHQVYVFERENKSDTIPDWMIPYILPKCKAAVITSASLANKTFWFQIEPYLTTSKVALVGPTTPMFPEAFEKVRIFAGFKIIDPDAALKVVSRGGGTKNLLREGAAVKVALLNHQGN